MQPADKFKAIQCCPLKIYAPMWILEVLIAINPLFRRCKSTINSMGPLVHIGPLFSNSHMNPRGMRRSMSLNIRKGCCSLSKCF